MEHLPAGYVPGILFVQPEFYALTAQEQENVHQHVPGILFVQPELYALTAQEQENVYQLYHMAHGYLYKAGSKNSRIKIKAINVSLYPYADIAQWWKIVNDAFSLSLQEIDNYMKN